MMNATPTTEADRKPRAALRHPWGFAGLALLVVLAIGVAVHKRTSSQTFPPSSAFNDSQQSSSDQLAAYSADVPKTVLELQRFRQSSAIHLQPPGGGQGLATLVNLNPTIGSWFVLTVTRPGTSDTSYHIENPAPSSQKLVLDQQFPAGLIIVEHDRRIPCELFGDALTQASQSGKTYAPLCGGRLFLRNPAHGQRTALESATEFLRGDVWGGEKVIDVFHHLLNDSHRETGSLQAADGARATATDPSSSLPTPASIDPQFEDSLITSANLGIPTVGDEKGGLRPGAWYPASGNPGVYVSLLQPDQVSPQILQSWYSRVAVLDSTEASSLSYLVAFDLDKFDLSYALGTQFPEVGWSDHIQDAMKDPRLPGPDGIGSIAPLVATGLVSPAIVPNVVSTFTAGFKRDHGAFKFGDLSRINHGSHFGFIQDGVVLSKLHPGLATVFVLDDGTVDLKTWTGDDDRLLRRIRYARQNGVPLVEFDKATQATIPGALVKQWGPGSWSGSEDSKLRTIRAGLALQQRDGKRFLIYAVFSDATPSSMARIFQAYQCQYGMLLDMNALEHTYLAVYRRAGTQLTIDHLVRGMSGVEKSASGQVVPRFLGYPDNRDFFYVTRRSP